MPQYDKGKILHWLTDSQRVTWTAFALLLMIFFRTKTSLSKMSNVLEMINEEGAMLDLKALSSSSGSSSKAGELDGVALEAGFGAGGEVWLNFGEIGRGVVN